MINEEINPLLVGHLNRKYGYVGFEPLPIGTPVFELDGRWFFEIKTLATKETSKQFFRKDSGFDKHFNVITTHEHTQKT